MQKDVCTKFPVVTTFKNCVGFGGTNEHKTKHYVFVTEVFFQAPCANADSRKTEALLYSTRGIIQFSSIDFFIGMTNCGSLVLPKTYRIVEFEYWLNIKGLSIKRTLKED